MILIGQYDSPFVRRVAIAMRLYGLGWEHRPWSTFREGELIAPYNPLRRVPTLVLDDGEVLIESMAMLDHLDEVAGDRALMAASGPERREAMRICAFASGLADKAVSLLYERLLHGTPSEIFIERCRMQIDDALLLLEKDRAARASRYWQGEALGHADIAVACAMRFTEEAHPGAIDYDRYPALDAHCTHCETLDVFREISQPFILPTRG